MSTTEDDGLDLVVWAVMRRHVHTETIPGAPKLIWPGITSKFHNITIPSLSDSRRVRCKCKVDGREGKSSRHAHGAEQDPSSIHMVTKVPFKIIKCIAWNESTKEGRLSSTCGDASAALAHV